MVGMEMATMVWSRAATKRASYIQSGDGKLEYVGSWREGNSYIKRRQDSVQTQLCADSGIVLDQVERLDGR